MQTRDADVVYHWGRENLKRLLLALVELNARIRTDRGLLLLPTGDPAVLKASSIWQLTTVHGDLDLLYDPAIGSYEDLVGDAAVVDIGTGALVLAASIDRIIASKEQADRDKDHRSLSILRRFRDLERGRRTRSGD